MKRLAVVLQDSLASLVRKGEIIPRYYNPGNFFQKVMLLGMQDQSCPKEAQALVGSAELIYRYVGKPHPLLSLGYSQGGIASWLRKAEVPAREFQPHALRIFSAGVNGLLGEHLKKSLGGVPLVCSVHGANDINRGLSLSGPAAFSERLELLVFDMIMRRIEKRVLRAADLNLAVYQAAASFVKRSGAQARVLYNFVASTSGWKTDYRINRPARLLNIGVQTRGVKEPSNIINAVDSLDARLDIAGDGNAHPELKKLVETLGLANKVNLFGFKPNDELTAAMPNYDLYVFRSNAPEVSKSVIEALLAGLPVIVSRGKGGLAPELEEADYLRVIDDGVESWRDALRELIQDQKQREYLGQRGREFALAHFSPEKVEAQHMQVYREIVDGAGGGGR